MDLVGQRLASMNWPYASRDAHAREEIGNRIAATARKQELVNYSNLVRGVTFTLPNVEGGRPFRIDAADWTDLHRAIIGDFLGYLSAESYSHAGIFISSIVVTKDDGTPGYGFTEFMREIGVLTSSDPMAAVTCWVEQVRKVFDWHSRHRA